MRISDWSSDVCSSDLSVYHLLIHGAVSPSSRAANEPPRQAEEPPFLSDGSRWTYVRPGTSESDRPSESEHRTLWVPYPGRRAVCGDLGVAAGRCRSDCTAEGGCFGTVSGEAYC